MAVWTLNCVWNDEGIGHGWSCNGAQKGRWLWGSLTYKCNSRFNTFLGPVLDVHRILTSGRGTSTLHIKMSGDLKVVSQWCKCVVPLKYVKSWRAKNSL